MKNIVRNLTPHEVKVVGENGEVVKSFPSDGATIRLTQETVVVGEVCGVPLTRTEYGAPVLVTDGVEGPLPIEEEGVFYIVSAMVKSALADRKDLLVPAEQVRDDQGRIIGCKSLGI